MPTVHIESQKEDIANIVLMPGDPARAEYIATKYLENVKEVNTVRKMTAYTGYYKNKKITIFPSGMGIPSMGIYSYELFNEYDVDTIIRIGSMGAYVEELDINDVVLVDDSVSDSTYAYMLDNYNKKNISSSKEVNEVIKKTAKSSNIELKNCNVYCGDVFYEQKDDFKDKVKNYQVSGVEMETFALFNNARVLNKKASALLTVSDLFLKKEKLTTKQREQGLNDMILLALNSCINL